MLLKKIWPICLLSILFISTSSSAKQIQIPNTQFYHLKSKINNVDYKIYVQLPLDYRYNKNKKYPVLYILDADWRFPLQNVNEGYIAVGIGYKDQNFSMHSEEFWKKAGIHRARDYLPTKETEIDRFKYLDEKYLTNKELDYVMKISGQAEKFKEFLTNELIPFVEKKYRDSKERIIYGHSFGGLFAAWILLNHPDIFDKYIILSPSLWYEKHWIFNQIDDKIKGISKTKMVYLAVGGLENSKNKEEYKKFMSIDDLREFYSKIKKNNKIDSKMDIIEGENHGDMCYGALPKSLKFLLEIK